MSAAAQCGLTPRSRRRPATAATVWPLQAQFGIVLPRPAGVCLRGRLSSNVRPHTGQPTGLDRSVSCVSHNLSPTRLLTHDAIESLLSAFRGGR